MGKAASVSCQYGSVCEKTCQCHFTTGFGHRQQQQPDKMKNRHFVRLLW
jgi:hypothetical protein